MKKVILIGGYPKGYDKPFHEDTHSGQVLRRLLGNKILEDEFILFDLWKNEEQEKNGVIHKNIYEKILKWKDDNYRIIALGKHVHQCLQRYGLTVKYLPHPACRSKTDLFVLKVGLEKALSDLKNG